MTKKGNAPASPQVGTLKGGVAVAGDVQAGQDVVMHDKKVVQNISIILQMGAYAPPPDLAQLKADYLMYLRRNHRALDFTWCPLNTCALSRRSLRR